MKKTVCKILVLFLVFTTLMSCPVYAGVYYDGTQYVYTEEDYMIGHEKAIEIATKNAIDYYKTEESDICCIIWYIDNDCRAELDYFVEFSDGWKDYYYTINSVTGEIDSRMRMSYNM